jgi:sec-independent protein translocase protein TatB
MLEIGWSKLVLIGIVALLVIGPKELPAVLRTLGQWMTKLRRMAAEFQSQFQEAMREAEMADLKKSVDEITGKAQSFTSFDPVGVVRREFESAQRQIETAAAAEPARVPEDEVKGPSVSSDAEQTPAHSNASTDPGEGSPKTPDEIRESDSNKAAAPEGQGKPA